MFHREKGREKRVVKPLFKISFIEYSSILGKNANKIEHICIYIYEYIYIDIYVYTYIHRCSIEIRDSCQAN